MNEKTVCVNSSYAYITLFNNYGALLQYFALEKYLEQRGHQVFWLRYRFKKATSPYVYFILLRKYYRNPKLFRANINVHRTFMNFCKNRINCSKQVYTSERRLEQCPPCADYYITGSDQVFGAVLKTNFLRFVKDNSKKIAYAVSFGRDELTEEQINKNIPQWIREFEAVSVREHTGIGICKTIGVEAKHLLDPTLLIDRSQYSKLFNDNSHSYKYIQCYFMNIRNNNDVYFAEIERLAFSNQLQLRVTSINNEALIFENKYLYFPSPENWLKSYAESQYIVTNTFHGMVFAIIFHRPFAVIMQKGETASANNRFYSLLEKLELQDCIYDGNNDLKTFFAKQTIFWETVDKKIGAERERTDEFFNKVGL